MAETTEISWAHSTFNPWIGCTKVSPGCDHCYAATLMDERYGRVKWGAGEPRSMTKTWGEPQRWNRLARASGEPWRVFCASLADVFDNEVPGEWRRLLGQLICDTPHLTWMLLTKRIGNVGMALEDFRWECFPGNVWLGITVVNQTEADRDIPKLLAAPAKVRWLSCEPLLEGINLADIPDPTGGICIKPLAGIRWLAGTGTRCGSYPRESPKIDWVIVGGESGKDARPIDPQWVRDIRDQCGAAGTAFHFKQWGGVRPKSNGHLLDGREHRAFPSPARRDGE